MKIMKFINSLFFILLSFSTYSQNVITLSGGGGGGGATTFTQLTDTDNDLGDRTDNLRVNMEENSIEFYEEDDDSGGEPLSFSFLDRISDIGASQAVASDGKYLYTTGRVGNSTTGHPNIYKYDKEGNLIMQHTNAMDKGTTGMTQINSIEIHEGKLYISSNNYASPQVPAPDSYIKVFNAHDLTYVQEYPVKDNICEGYSFHDGEWWGVYNDLMIVSRRDINFNPIAEYPLTYTVQGSFNYQGIVWIDNYILVNVHDGTSTTKFLDVYEWNGSGFSEVRRIDQINIGETGQGIFKEPNKNILWWAERSWPGQQNNVVKTRINYVEQLTNNN